MKVCIWHTTRARLSGLLTKPPHGVNEGMTEGRNNLHTGYHRAKSSGLLTKTPHGMNEGMKEGVKVVLLTETPQGVNEWNEGMKVFIWHTTRARLSGLLTKPPHGVNEGRNNLHMGYHRAKSSGLLTKTPHGVNEGMKEGVKVYLWDTTEVIRTADQNTTLCERRINK